MNNIIEGNSSRNDDLIGRLHGIIRPFVLRRLKKDVEHGLVLDADGTLSGTPTRAGTSTFTVEVSDEAAQTVAAAMSWKVALPVTLDASLVSAEAAVEYTARLSASGGDGPLVFRLTSGTLPAGVVFADDGTFSGVPLAAGTFPLTVTVSDADGRTAAGSPTLTVARSSTLSAPLVSLSVAPSRKGLSGSATVTTVDAADGAVSGVSVSAVWRWQAGSRSGSRTVSGRSISDGTTVFAVPSVRGTTRMELCVTGLSASGFRSPSAPFGCSVWTPPPSSIAAPPPAAVGVNYEGRLVVTGGTSPLRFSAAPATLPGGLVLSSDGFLSGRAAASGRFPVMVTVTDLNGRTLTQRVVVTVSEVVRIAEVSVVSVPPRKRNASPSLQVVVRVSDSAGRPVPSVTVRGVWDPSNGRSVSGRSGRDGVVRFTAPSGSGALRFCVSSATRSGFVFDPDSSRCATVRPS